MNRKILITGGAQRIGKALVNHFHEQGWDIIFQYRSSKASADEISKHLNSIRANLSFNGSTTFRCLADQ